MAVSDFKGKNAKQYFEQAFNYFDIDGSGGITYEEVSQFLDSNDIEMKRIFQEVDRNRDGLISKAEFIEIILSK